MLISEGATKSTQNGKNGDLNVSIAFKNVSPSLFLVGIMQMKPAGTNSAHNMIVKFEGPKGPFRCKSGSALAFISFALSFSLLTPNLVN